MLKIEYVWWMAAVILLAATILDLRARRWANALFWLILAGAFAGGDSVIAASKAGNALPAQFAGVCVIVLALLAGSGVVRRHAADDGDAAQRRASAARLGHHLFGPALLIPAVTAAVILFGGYFVVRGVPLLAKDNSTLTALALGCVIAVAAALRVTRSRPLQPLVESSRLLDAMSWAVVLPMLLAALGGVFAATGVGDIVASLVGRAIPTDSAIACVLAYGIGMVLFTVIMGNAFAAFPVMTGGIALPLLIQQHGADPAVVGALGMLTGYCGTLLTPMAANFNIVPAALLELKDQYGVIRSQVPTALPLILINLFFLYVFAFR